MTKFKNKFRIESARLSVWDYSKPWYYFVTINTKNHLVHFGQIKNGEMNLNESGKVVEKCWQEIPRHSQNVELDYYVIMPNHVHGIIIINEQRRDVACNVSTLTDEYSQISPKANSLSVIIRSFQIRRDKTDP